MAPYWLYLDIRRYRPELYLQFNDLLYPNSLAFNVKLMYQIFQGIYSEFNRVVVKTLAERICVLFCCGLNVATIPPPSKLRNLIQGCERLLPSSHSNLMTDLLLLDRERFNKDKASKTDSLQNKIGIPYRYITCAYYFLFSARGSIAQTKWRMVIFYYLFQTITNGLESLTTYIRYHVIQLRTIILTSLRSVIRNGTAGTQYLLKLA